MRVLPIALVYSTRPPVSVMRYGHAGLARGFSRQVGSTTLPSNGCRSPEVIAAQSTRTLQRTRQNRPWHRHHPSGSGTGFPTRLHLPTGLHRNPLTGWPTLLRHPIAQAARRGTGILTRCPSPTPCGLGLGPTDPMPSNVASETLGISAGAFFTRLSLLVPAFSLLRTPTVLTVCLCRAQNAPLLLCPQGQNPRLRRGA
jgi:hypothetical protein